MIGAFPFFGDDTAVFCAVLVVEDLVFDDVTAELESGHDLSVGWDVVVAFF